jgi:hypothetical protein
VRSTALKAGMKQVSGEVRAGVGHAAAKPLDQWLTNILPTL